MIIYSSCNDTKNCAKENEIVTKVISKFSKLTMCFLSFVTGWFRMNASLANAVTNAYLFDSSFVTGSTLDESEYILCLTASISASMLFSCLQSLHWFSWQLISTVILCLHTTTWLLWQLCVILALTFALLFPVLFYFLGLKINYVKVNLIN